MVVYGASPWVLLDDGTLLQSGYSEPGEGSGMPGGGTNVNFFTREEAVGHEFKKLWGGSSTRIALDNDNHLWGASYNNVTILGESTRDWNFNELEKVPFDIQNLLDIQITGNNVFYLLKDGSVYASGNYTFTGVNSQGTTYIDGIKLISGEGSSFPSIKTLYGGESSLGEFIKSDRDRGDGSANNLFLGNDGNLYLVGSSALMFRNDILEQNWVEIAKDVVSFEPRCPAYINSKGELFVAGNMSDCLGLGSQGYTSNQKVKKFIKVEDPKIMGKAKKFQCRNSNCFVLTTDNILYGTGYYSYSGSLCYAGWSDATDKKEYVQLLTDIVDFSCRGNNLIAITSTGTAYGWGLNYSGTVGVTGFQSTTPIQYTLDANIQSSALPNNVQKLSVGSAYKSFILTKSGDFYISGSHPNYTFDGGFQGASTKFVKFDYSSYLENDEKIVDFAMMWDTTIIFLTNKGRVYGYGVANVLGLGKRDSNYITLQYLGIDNVCSISAGKNNIVVIKNDGSVWGTGDNRYGVLGRWANSDRNKTNSRYKTAFNWVECPELEL